MCIRDSVSLAYRRAEIPHPLSGHGYVVPRGEGGPILACTWSSRKWAGRAPDGWELLRVFIGRAGHLQQELATLPDEALVALAQEEIAARLGVSAPPRIVRVQRWPRGMPQYLLGHPERIARIEAAGRSHPGLFLAGSAYHGVGLPDCIASGERAAKAALAHLREDETTRQEALFADTTAPEDERPPSAKRAQHGRATKSGRAA